VASATTRGGLFVSIAQSNMENSKKSISFQEFIEGYRKGVFTVSVRKSTAGNFVLSKFADKHNKPAYLFFHWLEIILLMPLPIILLFMDWHYAIFPFIGGLIVRGGLKKSAIDFIVQNMLEDQNFCGFILYQDGAKIMDKDNREYITYS
jgi:hypothetical protein